MNLRLETCLELRRAQFGLRMQHATQQLANTSQIKKVRRDIARILTVAKQKRTGDEREYEDDARTQRHRESDRLHQERGPLTLRWYGPLFSLFVAAMATAVWGMTYLSADRDAHRPPAR